MNEAKEFLRILRVLLPPPPGVASHSLALDPERGDLVLFAYRRDGVQYRIRIDGDDMGKDPYAVAARVVEVALTGEDRP